MYHTALLFQPIHALDFPKVSSYLAALSKEKKSRHFPDTLCPDLHIYPLYDKYGIIIMLRRTRLKDSNRANSNGRGVEVDSQGIYYHAIEIRLNPKVLIQENEYVKVARASDYNDIRGQFKKVLKPIQKLFEGNPSHEIYRFNELSEYQVKRFDYCINIRTELHEVYMGLIKRADVPARFIVMSELDEKTGRRKSYDQSFYLQTKKHSVGINFYNKQYQMYKDFEDYERLEDACNIIRLEIQCLAGKTNSMKQKHEWKYRDFINFANDDISRKMIYDYYEKTVGFEDYYTLEEAKRRVLSFKVHRNKTKAKIVEVLELVNQKRSIHKARLEYSDELSDKKAVTEFNSVIKIIKKSGTNPVTIPVNWGYSHIPNLVEEMDKEFTQLLRVV
ncbi:hypothetical protein [Paenibacillus sp. IITD108]|uniref:hypothetical protein n=1 Tax=Paenibacillus sp. IITD108 TaxID=3116649 RepID=UPI002F426003